MAPTDEGFAAFAEAQLPRLLGYARLLCGNSHDAWDLTQETLVRMGVRWRKIDPAGNPAAYARTTLVRLNIDRMRRSGRERVTSTPPDSAVAAITPEGVEPWLAEAIMALPLRQRTALVLRYLDDLDLPAVARTMGCTHGTARSHVSRGLARLRELAPVGSSLATPTTTPVEGDDDV